MVISHKVHIVDIVLLGTSCAPCTILPSSAFSHIHVCKLIVLQSIWYHLSGLIYWLITDSFLDRMVFFGFTNWLTLLTTCKWVTNHQIGWQSEFLTNWLIDWLFKCLTKSLPDYFSDWLIDRYNGWLVDWLTGWLNDLLTCLLTHPLPNWLTGWLACDLLTNWLSDWLNSRLFDWWLIYWLTNGLTYNWFIDSLTDRWMIDLHVLVTAD